VSTNWFFTCQTILWLNFIAFIFRGKGYIESRNSDGHAEDSIGGCCRDEFKGEENGFRQLNAGKSAHIQRIPGSKTCKRKQDGKKQCDLIRERERDLNGNSSEEIEILQGNTREVSEEQIKIMMRFLHILGRGS